MRFRVTTASEYLRPFFACSCIALISFFNATAQASTPSLQDDEIAISALFPDESTVFVSDVVTVGVGVEVEGVIGDCSGDSNLCSYFGEFSQIDIEMNSITFSVPGGSVSGFTVAEFNGLLFDDLDWGPGYALEGFSLTTNFPGLTDDRVSFTEDSIRVNLQGIASLPTGAFMTLDLLVVPEPNAVLLLVVGATCLGMLRLT